MKLIDYIRKIAKTGELDAKIKSITPATDKSTIGSLTGIAFKEPEETCPAFYSTRSNSYDIADLLAQAAGPTLSEPCSRLDAITGLTDLDVADNPSGSTVLLVIRVNGEFE